ncbi:trigger factor [Mycoplasmopsis maculosa]|uniref:Trigger factor n=1 Tax=Mycoplasmopsis maculosa TaxID=114885 RepID=A0A449B458_9BACT|nr:hypothetical protein [Mycoplasmopsis maculosa]VEU75355.1 trigger factor [Mycoplasmopsis maculosa]
MVNFKTKKIFIDFQDELLNKEKNEALMTAIATNQKIRMEDINKIALNGYVKKQTDTLIKEINTESPKSLILQPILNIIEEKENAIKAELSISYYLFSDLNKVDLENSKIELEYQQPPVEYLDEIYNNMVNNYTLLKESKEAIKQDDFITFDADIYFADQLVKQEKNIEIEVKQTNDFSINNLVIGKNKNELIETNAPDGTFWKITINKILRPTVTKLTNENISEIRLSGVNSLEDFKNKIYYDTRKENVQLYLLKFYENAINSITNKNEFNIPEENINYNTNLNIDNYLMQLMPEHRQSILEEFKNKTQNAKNMLETARMQAISSFNISITENAILTRTKIEVTDEEAQDKFNKLKESIASNNPNMSIENVKRMLKHQKCALYLIKIWDKELYEKVSKDIELDV